MNLHQYRFGKGDDSTLSELYDADVFECFILEDELRRIKVHGETAMPADRFEILLRREGEQHEKYGRRFPWHEGMLHFQNVPNFQYCQLHPGNTDDDTKGCPLPGEVPQIYPDGNFTVGRSTPAYERLYKKIVAALHRNERVFWEIHNDARHIVAGV